MLNENIKQLRQARGISQVELAKELNVTKQCVSNWENDNIQPSVEMLVKLAKFFGVTTDFLLDLQTKDFLLVEGLSREQLAHLRLLIEDLKNAR
jgi:transcriptional regulator with XRE-family HTH domain